MSKIRGYYLNADGICDIEKQATRIDNEQDKEIISISQNGHRSFIMWYRVKETNDER